MRVHGTLIKWNDDRGFGFIRPAKGDSEVFVHISAFPREGGRPLVGELISFEIEDGKDGRQRAVGVMRPGQRTKAKQAPRSLSHRPSRILGGAAVLSVIVIASIVGYVSFRLANDVSSAPDDDSNAFVEEEEQEAQPSFHCDGRTMCSQMTSCREAIYFIQNCPGTKMDGDRDGVPCEDQFCRR